MLSIEPIKVADLEPAELAARIAEVRIRLAMTFNLKNVAQDTVQSLAELYMLVEAGIQKGVVTIKS